MSGAQGDAAWFRHMLARLGHTQASFARWLAENGDDRPPATIARGIRRCATGEAHTSGEMKALLTILAREQADTVASE